MYDGQDERLELAAGGVDALRAAPNRQERFLDHVFGVVLWMSRKGFEADALHDYKGLNRRNPWFAFVMLLVINLIQTWARRRFGDV